MDKYVILVEQQAGHINTCTHLSPLSRDFRTLPTCNPVVIQDANSLKEALAQVMHAKSISKVTTGACRCHALMATKSTGLTPCWPESRLTF